VSIFVRSLIFNVAFYLNLAIYMLVALPICLLPLGALLWLCRSWARTNLFLLRTVCNIGVEFRGVEKIPPGALLVASKHQSLWETFALMMLFPEFAYILKRELQWIPLFGWLTIKARMIPVDRGGGGAALLEMTKLATQRFREGRQLLIFPEGTRRPVGAEPRYKFGVAQIYAECGVACLPVALNSGLYWPRRTFMRYPGTVRAEVLDPIQPGLSREDMLARLRDDIEAATARLVEQGRRELAEAGIRPAPVAEPASGGAP
jgi:1-acyl-sn-glycerol-3-phosphate acyltransferase